MIEKQEEKKTKTEPKTKISIQEELGIPEVVSEELLRKHQLEYILIKKYLVGFEAQCRFAQGSGIASEITSALRRLANSGLDFTNSEDYETIIKDLKRENQELKVEISQLKGKMAKAEKTIGKLF